MTLFNMGILYFNGVLLKLNTCFYLFYITRTNITFCTLQFHVDLQQLPLYPKKHKAITSMSRRIEAVIQAKGAPTKYWVHIQ